MNSSRCSKLAAVLAVVLLFAAVAPVAAVSISGTADDTVKVGEKQTASFTMTEPFTEYEQWTLQLQTELNDVSWTVTTYDNADNQVDEVTKNGQSVQYQLAASDGVVRVEVKLEGTTPPASAFDWSYDPPQQITYAKLVQAQQGGSSDVLKTFSARPYTQSSEDARTAIEDAQQAIDDAKAAGAGVGDAEGDLKDAVEFYNAGQFEQAVENANEAKDTANAAASSASQMDLLIKVGAAVVVLLVVLGGVYWYLQQRDSYDKLG